MIIHNMHVYFINRILKTELLFILCSGQKCLQFYLTFTSCLPLPLLTFCQIKNIEKKNMCPGGQRYFQDLELLQVVINSLSQLFVRLCHATLWNRDHAISSLKVKVKSLNYFSWNLVSIRAKQVQKAVNFEHLLMSFFPNMCSSCQKGVFTLI